MLVLGIESSCDDSSAALFDTERGVLSNHVSSQEIIHREYGGIVPEFAARAHLEQVPLMIDRAMADVKATYSDIGAVAATYGPGLIGSLLVGLSIGKSIAYSRGIPFIGVNHIEGHLLSPFIGSKIEYPFMALVVSGGHSLIYLVKEGGSYNLISSTRDDAAGEALDKMSKALGLGFPGGKIIDEYAKDGDPGAIKFPRGMYRKDSLDMSFSGLKAAVVRYIKAEGIPKSKSGLSDLLASAQEAVIDTVINKLKKAIKLYPVPLLAVSGGVAANSRLREKLKALSKNEGFLLKISELKYCTDNAAMIAHAGSMRLLSGECSPWSLNAKANDLL